MKVKVIKESKKLKEGFSPEEISAIIQANEALYNLIKTGVVYGNVAVWATHLINYLTKLQNKKDDRFDKTLEKLKSDKPN
tara:strand:+ start:657 stop:896 length:240 start_codon:yes stop_codon:yes gene_type:complete